MATDESNNPAPSSNPSLPQYPEMIMAAIVALNDKEGSSKTAIAGHIEATYGQLPGAHATLLSHHLNKMRQSGELVMIKNNYARPDPDAPPKRGRGRPPKPKSPMPAGSVASPPRPRGRPPKPRDPFATSPTTPKQRSSGSGKPRGRPPKKAKVDDSPLAASPVPVPSPAPALSSPAPLAASPAPGSGTPRGRGRPPKVKPSVAAVGA